MPTNLDVSLDDTASDQAASVLVKVQVDTPAATIDDVYTWSVRSGLNHIEATWPGGQFPAFTASDYVVGADDTATVTVAVDGDDMARVSALMAQFSVAAKEVVGVAVCTGLALVDGVWVRKRGPFVFTV